MGWSHSVGIWFLFLGCVSSDRSKTQSGTALNQSLNYAHHSQIGSIWYNSDTNLPEALELDPHIARMTQYAANCNTPWKEFRMLHGSHSGLKFLTQDILDKVRSDLIDNGIYYDTSAALQQAVTDVGADAALQNIDLPDLVRHMHDNGAKTCLQKDIDVCETIDKGKKSVEDYLLQRGVPQDKAERVAQGWYRRVFTHYLPCGDPLTQITLTVYGLAHRPRCSKEDRERDSNRQSGPARKLDKLVVT